MNNFVTTFINFDGMWMFDLCVYRNEVQIVNELLFKMDCLKSKY
jgi:hypothetical protein